MYSRVYISMIDVLALVELFDLLDGCTGSFCLVFVWSGFAFGLSPYREMEHCRAARST